MEGGRGEGGTEAELAERATGGGGMNEGREGRKSMGGGGGGGREGEGLQEGETGGGGESGFEVVFFAFAGDLPPGVEDGVGGFLEDLFVVVGLCGEKGRVGEKVRVSVLLSKIVRRFLYFLLLPLPPSLPPSIP